MTENPFIRQLMGLAQMSTVGSEIPIALENIGKKGGGCLQKNTGLSASFSPQGIKMAHKQNLHREKGFCKKTPLPNPNKQAQGASTPYRTMRHWQNHAPLANTISTKNDPSVPCVSRPPKLFSRCNPNGHLIRSPQRDWRYATHSLILKRLAFRPPLLDI
jgi:hypothetical protein